MDRPYHDFLGIASSLLMLVNNEIWFYVLRFIIGATEAGFLPCIILYLTYWFPATRGARINALFMTSIAAAGVIRGPVAGFIMTRFAGVYGLVGWQWLFLLEGLPTIALGLFVFVWLVDNIGKAKWLSVAEKKILQDNIDRENAALVAHSLVDAIRQPATIFLSIVYLFMLMGLYGLTFWLPQLIKNTGIASPMTIGMLSTIPYATAWMAMVWITRSFDRHGERRWHRGLCIFAVGHRLCIERIIWRQYRHCAGRFDVSRNRRDWMSAGVLDLTTKVSQRQCRCG